MLRIIVCLVLWLLVPTTAQAEWLTPVGIWLHENQRIQVEIAPCGDQLCGRLVWLKRPNDPTGQPRTDQKNPDPALRARSVLGLTVLDGLHRAGDNSWEGGRIYNPDDGKTYSANLSLLPDGSLSVHAFIAITVLGKTQVWTRVR